jgi:hypothetical protein
MSAEKTTFYEHFNFGSRGGDTIFELTKKQKVFAPGRQKYTPI